MISSINRERPAHIATYTLGDHNGNKRAWVHSRHLINIGLNKGAPVKMFFKSEEQKIEVILDEAGDKKVYGRPNGTPIIDIKNKQVAETLGHHVEMITVKFFKGRVEISVSAKEQKLNERRSKTNNKFVEIFSGGGTSSKFAEMVGFKADACVEREEKFLEIYDKNINATTTICADVHEVDVNDLPKDCSFLQFGYPCTAYTQGNIVLKAEQKNNSEERCQVRREADYLSLALLDIIKHVNPRAILIEEVPEFLNSIPFDLLSFALEKMKYKITTTHVTGSFTERKRVAIVAVADKEAEIDLTNIQYQASRPISEHLDVPVHEREFQHISERPRESGAVRKGLGIRSHSPDDLKINTITTHWTRHTHVSLRHPFKSDYYSDFTVNEVRRMHGLPEDFDCGEKVTIARAVLGQGVCDGFLDILKRIHTRICSPSNTSKLPKVQDMLKKHLPTTDEGQLLLAI